MSSDVTFERWKTLSRKDPEFKAYLDGSFSKEYRALPVRSLNVEGSRTSLREQVTFEVLPVSKIERPPLGRVIWQLIRPPSLVISIGPMLAALVFCFAHQLEVNHLVAATSFIGVLLFQIAVNLLNDYGDHMGGQDRLRSRGGSRVIQSGWLRAITVERAAWSLIGLATLCGLPAIFFHFAPVGIFAILALLLALEFTFQKVRLKYHGFAEIVAFILTGPLLTAGYAWAASAMIHLNVIWMGAIFGSIALLYFHSANFENIMADSQAGVRTWATRTGFDASKKFFAFTAALIVGTSLFYVLAIEQNLRLLPVVIMQVLFLMPVFGRVSRLQSPLASELVGLRNEALKLYWFTLIALIGGYAWMMTVAG